MAKLVTECYPLGYATTDSDAYDGASDASPINSIVGYGSTEAESIEDFWEKASNYPEDYPLVTECCKAEPYDDEEFCSECYRKNPTMVRD